MSMLDMKLPQVERASDSWFEWSLYVEAVWSRRHARTWREQHRLRRIKRRRRWHQSYPLRCLFLNLYDVGRTAAIQAGRSHYEFYSAGVYARLAAMPPIDYSRKHLSRIED